MAGFSLSGHDVSLPAQKGVQDRSSSRAERAPAVPPTTWIETDLGDTEFKVDEHADGMFTIDVPDDRLVLNAERM